MTVSLATSSSSGASASSAHDTGTLFAGDRDFQFILDHLPKFPSVQLKMGRARVYEDLRRRTLWMVFDPDLQYEPGTDLSPDAIPFSFRGKDRGLTACAKQAVAIWGAYYLGGSRPPHLGCDPSSPAPSNEELVDSWAVLFRDGDGRLRQSFAYDSVDVHTHVYYGDPDASGAEGMRCIDAAPIKGWNQDDFSTRDFFATAKMTEQILKLGLSSNITLRADMTTHEVRAYDSNRLLATASTIDDRNCLVTPRKLASRLFNKSSYCQNNQGFREVWNRYMQHVSLKIQMHMEDRFPAPDDIVIPANAPLLTTSSKPGRHVPLRSMASHTPDTSKGCNCQIL